MKPFFGWTGSQEHDAKSGEAKFTYRENGLWTLKVMRFDSFTDALKMQSVFDAVYEHGRVDAMREAARKVADVFSQGAQQP